MRYRLDYPLPGRPDIVFPTARVAVFCDGDFWHGRNWAERRRRLERGSNADYWVKKIAANRARDARYNRALKELGWTVVRFWETDILADPARPAAEIEALIRRRGAPGQVDDHA
jgi:DNA mismatch endonuclease, patch repair protein